jgi:hypothetical protein
MGFFSWDCKVCGHPMISHYAVNGDESVDISWMTHVVVIDANGSILRGEYDGYGRVDGREVDWTGEPQCYHKKCWELAGRPVDYNEPSKSAYDQGFFFDDEHDVPEPKTFKEAIAARPSKPAHKLKDEIIAKLTGKA